MAQTKKSSNQIRIGGGAWRSRLLRFPDVPGLRPTPDRVRETLFNWLGQDMHGLSCLDLFSGTGAMGFEALSRGASETVMIEKSSLAYKSLAENKKLLNAENAMVMQADAVDFLARNTHQFDVIFLDPPYNQGWLDKLLPMLSKHISADGYLYAEAEYALEDTEQWEVLKHGRAGAVFYHLLKNR